MKEKENAFVFWRCLSFIYPAGLPLIERGATHARRVFKRRVTFSFLKIPRKTSLVNRKRIVLNRSTKAGWSHQQRRKKKSDTTGVREKK
jgi:hypothetical protein